MNSLNILGFTKDLRTNTNVVYAQISINEYFDLIGVNYNKFPLQRRKENHPKGYSRLRDDLEKGAVIPGITLALEPNVAKHFVEFAEKENKKEIIKKLNENKQNVYILDGLQRTHIIKELLDKKVVFVDEHKLLLEIWIEPQISHLLYRLIVLNSGQKPMSMRHQIELLFTTMRKTLTDQITDLELLVENEDEKRTKAKQFPFERVVTAYKSFLTRSPEVNKSNTISDKLLEAKIMESSEDYLSSNFNLFRDYLKQYTELDEELFRICDNTELKSFRNWFADANVINSFFSAVGKLQDTRSDRIQTGINALLTLLKSADIGEDILQLNEYKIIREKVADPKMYNVGFATRKLLSNSFNEYLRDEGYTSLYNCWVQESIPLQQKNK